GLFEVREPQHRWQGPADLVQHVHGTSLALAKLLDEHDALLELCLPLLELLDVLNNCVEACGFLLRFRNRLVELRRFLLERPVAPPDEEHSDNQDRAAPNRQFLRNMKRERAFDRLAFDRKQVDANHRSPAFLSAKPTATAAVGTTLSTLSTPSLP